MPVKKIKSKDYLDYIARMPCAVTGKRPSECHHESVTRLYSAGLKKNFDFGAIPLDHETHLYERHGWGKHRFWENYGIDPVEVVINLIQGYIDEGRIDAEIAINALEMVKRDNGYTT